MWSLWICVSRRNFSRIARCYIMRALRMRVECWVMLCPSCQDWFPNKLFICLLASVSNITIDENAPLVAWPSIHDWFDNSWCVREFIPHTTIEQKFVHYNHPLWLVHYNSWEEYAQTNHFWLSIVQKPPADNQNDSHMQFLATSDNEPTATDGCNEQVSFEQDWP